MQVRTYSKYEAEVEVLRDRLDLLTGVADTLAATKAECATAMEENVLLVCFFPFL